MGINIKLYFNVSKKRIYFFDTGFIKANIRSNITFTSEEIGFSKTMTIDEFMRSGVEVINNYASFNTVRIQSSENIFPGCDHSGEVYMVEGSLPYLGGENQTISNFDKTCLPLFDTSKLLKVDGSLLSNNTSVKSISYLFSDHREWRTSYSSSGNKLQYIPYNLFNGFNANLIELNGYMTRMDNILAIPPNHMSSLSALRSFRGFNDCPKLADIQGAKIISSNLNFMIAFNDLPANILIPSDLINSGGSGYLMLYLFNNVGHSVKPIAFNNIINAPEKRIGFMSDIKLKYSKVDTITNSKRYVEFGTFNIESVTNDETLVNTWRDFYKNTVLPNIMDEGNLSGVENIHTKNIG